MSIATEKLQKRLASTGLGSRRDMEEAIKEGRVTVNNRIATLGDRVSAEDEIMLDGRPLPTTAATAAPRVLMYNKPESEICTMSDPEGRRTVFQSLPKVRSGRWIAVGRLDINTTGLLIFTTDGALANALMHPSSNIDREYLCRVRGDIDDDILKRLQQGVLLDDGLAKFTSIASGGSSEGSNHWFYVTLEEGRNREVRRLWESQGAQVSRLKRVRYGSLTLPSRLKMGQWLEMAPEEVASLYKMAGLKPPATLGALTPQQLHDRKRQERQNTAVKPGKPGVQKFRSKSATERFSQREDKTKAPARRDGLQWLDSAGEAPVKSPARKPAGKSLSRTPKTDRAISDAITACSTTERKPLERDKPQRQNPQRDSRTARAENSTRPAVTGGAGKPRSERSDRSRSDNRPSRDAARSDSRSNARSSRSEVRSENREADKSRRSDRSTAKTAATPRPHRTTTRVLGQGKPAEFKPRKK